MIDIEPRGFVRHLSFLLSAPLIWFIYFGLIYGAVGFGGAFGFAPEDVLLFTWGATLAAAAAIIAMSWRAPISRTSLGREDRQADHEIARALGGLSLFAILLEALVLWIVPLWTGLPDAH